MRTEEPPEIVTVHQNKNLYVNDLLNQNIPKGNEQEPLATSLDMEVRGSGDEVMVESFLFQESVLHFQNSVSTKVPSDALIAEGSVLLHDTITMFGKVVKSSKY